LYWSSTENSQYTIYCIKVLSFVCCAHLRDLNTSLGCLASQYRFTGLKVHHQLYMAAKLRHFIREHHLMVHMVRHSNHFASKALAAAAVSEVAFNVYMITLITFQQSTPLARLLVMLLLTVQI